jgi:hypothetical protein
MDFDEFKLHAQAAFEALNVSEKQANALLEKRANPAATATALGLAGQVAGAIPGYIQSAAGTANAVTGVGRDVLNMGTSVLNAGKDIGAYGLALPIIAGGAVGSMGGLVSGTLAGQANEAKGWPDETNNEKEIMDEIQTRKMISQIDKHRQRIDQMNNLYSRSN